MKQTLLGLFLFFSIACAAQTGDADNHSRTYDSLSKKLVELEKKISDQDETIEELKKETGKSLKHGKHGLHLRHDKNARSRVIVDRSGSKQSHVIYE